MNYLVFYPISGLVATFESFNEASEYVLQDARECYLDYGDEYNNFKEYFESEFDDVEILSEQEAKELQYV